jgi:uncharacterized membrane protein HdeD (DUF308 family)
MTGIVLISIIGALALVTGITTVAAMIAMSKSPYRD